MFLRKVHFWKIYFIIYLLPVKTTTKYSLTLIAICLYNSFLSKILKCFVYHDHLVVAEYLGRTMFFEAQAAVWAAGAACAGVLHAAIVGHAEGF